MTEDELLAGITDALTAAGWRWSHHRRSDLAVMMGDPGLPDIIAYHPARGHVLAWELKTARGVVSPGQTEWIRGLAAASTIDARFIRPDEYDQALAVIVGQRDPGALIQCVVCGEPAVRTLDPATGRGLCRIHNP